MNEVPALTLTFIYDHAAGNYEVVLPNFARFRVERNQVSGKLENNLELYRKRVISLLAPATGKTPRTKSELREELVALCGDIAVNVVGPRKRLTLDDLEID